jgi:hypothetical protein
MYNCTPHIQGNTDSKPLRAKLATNNTTNYKTTALLHTNNHEQCQKNDDEPWQATKQQIWQQKETSS